MRSIETALAQTGVNVEVIVVDDGSDLPAEDYVRPDPRVRVLRHPTSQGVSAARNLGARAASHRWVAFLDDDDLWAPHKLQTQVAAMEASGRRWSHTGMVRLDAALDVISIEPADPAFAVYPRILELNGVATPTAVVIDRELLAEAGGFDPAFSIMADWDLWVRVAKLAAAEVVAEPLVGYVVHSGSMHRQGTRALVEELREMQSKYRGQHAVGGPYTWKWIAETHRRTGHLLGSLPLYARSALSNPYVLWQTRSRLMRGLRRRVAAHNPNTAPDKPAWLRSLPAADVAHAVPDGALQRQGAQA